MGNVTLHLNVDKDGKRKKGTFNQVSDFILFNKNLEGDAVRIFIFITSQSKDYNINQTDIMNKCNLKRYSFDKADAQLKDFGFLKIDKSKGKNQWHYTVSEFGNLNEKDITEDDLNKFIQLNNTAILNNQSQFELIMLNDISNKEKKEHIQLIIDEFKVNQKVFYKECISMTTKYDTGSKKAQQEFKGWLSQKIYQSYETKVRGNSSSKDDFHPPSKWSQISNKYKKVEPTNHEDTAQEMSEQSL